MPLQVMASKLPCYPDGKYGISRLEEIDVALYNRAMERRLTKSHPDWESLNKVANDLAIAMNAHVFFWGFDETGQPTVIDELERIATVEKVREAMAEHLEGGRFADWINTGVLFK
jgi:hypothetical protein